MEIQAVGHLWSKDEEGHWKWKPDPQFHKKDGRLKARYRDLPAFKAIYQIEDIYQQSFDETIRETSKMLIRRLNVFGLQKLKH